MGYDFRQVYAMFKSSFSMLILVTITFSILIGGTVGVIRHDTFKKIVTLRDGAVVDRSSLFSELKVPNLLRCARKCSRHSSCIAIAYTMSNSTCRLLDSVPDFEDTVSMAGWTFYSKSIQGEFSEWGKSGCNRQGYQQVFHLCLKIQLTVYAAYDSANTICGEDGGHLLRITSEDDQRAVARYLDNNMGKGTRPIIDGRRADEHSPFLYADGANVTFLNWYDPISVVNSTKLCTKILPLKDYKWDVARCAHNKRFVCQIEI